MLTKSFLLISLLLSVDAFAQAVDTPDSTGQAGEVASDTDPTKPVLLSLYNYFTRINDQAWINSFVFRFDKLVLSELEIPNRSRGILTRFDIPLVTRSISAESNTGLGDIYMQALIAPRIESNFFTACGTGLSVPTATSASLGTGKWVAAPALVPVLFFPGKGFAYLKFQDWISFAGNSDRKEIHYLTITPAYLGRIAKRFWIFAEIESNTNWLNNSHTWFRSGLLGGYMISPHVGIWMKGEIPFGQYRTSNWSIKTGFFITRS